MYAIRSYYVVGGAEAVGKHLREVARLHPRGLGQHHRGVGGDFAVARVAAGLGAHPRDVETGGQRALRGEGGDRIGDAALEFGKQIHGLTFGSNKRACSSRAKRSVIPAT